jgi:hypothetical protein
MHDDRRYVFHRFTPNLPPTPDKRHRKIKSQLIKIPFLIAKAELSEGMAFFLKRLLAFCALAGMASAVIHEEAHSNRQSYTHTHDHDDHHGHDHHPLPSDCEDHDSTPHHHHCCHFPVADRPSLDHHALAIFHGILLEISTERSLIPDEPFFSMDKPPLI